MNYHVIQELHDKILQYKKKYYVNQLLKGSLIAIGLIGTVFLFISIAEFYGRFNSFVRASLLFSFLAFLAIVLYEYIGKPIYHLLRPYSGTNEALLINEIGFFYPGIKDKLQNTLQLAALTAADSDLLRASIEQKSSELNLYKFTDAISFGTNKRYLPYAIPPIVVIAGIMLLYPSFFPATSQRIVQFQNKFAEPAPFSFEILNKSLKATKGKDYLLHLKLNGKSIPQQVYIVYNDRRFVLSPKNASQFDYLFENVSLPIRFHFEAAGFNSDPLTIDLVNAPALKTLSVELAYPSYLNKPAERLDNIGNLTVPAGTVISWHISSDNASSCQLNFKNPPISHSLNKTILGDYTLKKQIITSTDYALVLSNSESSDLVKSDYSIQVLADQLPTISVQESRDSSLLAFTLLQGVINDDYGFTNLKLFYKKNGSTFQSINLPFRKNQLNQSFFYQFDLASLQLKPAEKLEYFIQVWDNDAVHGFKSARSSTYTIDIPTKLEVVKELSQNVNDVTTSFDKLINKSRDFKNELAELEKKMLSKKSLDYQDKKEIQDLLKQKEELQNQINQLKDQIQKLAEKQNQLSELPSEIQQKLEQLQKLLNELMNSKNDELTKTLEKLLEDKNQTPNDNLTNSKKNERNLDRNIERSMQLFKNMQIQLKKNELISNLNKLADKQDEAARKLDEKTPLTDSKKEQNQINDDFKALQQQLKDLEKMQKDARKETNPDDQKAMEDIGQSLNNAKKELDNNSLDEAGKSQKKASRRMKQLSQQMADSMKSGEMKQLDLDMDALRDLLENLVKLSFEQERLMKELRTVKSDNPKFVELAQQQLKLGDDARVAEDSLYSLAQRVMQIESLVTSEVTTMRNTLDEVSQLLRDRKVPQANAKQQFAMTSINNLALLLSDTFKQMQQMMMDMKGKGGKKGSLPMPGLGEKQKSLNDKLQDLSEKQLDGKQLSQELSKLAQQQAQLRNQLKQLQDRLNGTEAGKKLGGQLQQMQNQMDQTENELVNKRVTPTLLQRQRSLETRLLEAEKAIKEQELDPQRKGKTGMTFQRVSPPNLESFKSIKDRQLELLQTTPIQFTPYYTNESTNYLRKIK